MQLLATGSGDESVKLWDLSNNQPSWIATHMPDAVRAMNKCIFFVPTCFCLLSLFTIPNFDIKTQGIVFSVSFSADCPFLLAVGGSEGKLKVSREGLLMIQERTTYVYRKLTLHVYVQVWDTMSETGVSRRYGSNRP